MVCFIHRPEYYKILEDEKGNSLIGMAEIIIAKHRNGATGDVTLRFKSEFARFQNVGDEFKYGGENTFGSKANSDNDSGISAYSSTTSDIISAGSNDNLPF